MNIRAVKERLARCGLRIAASTSIIGGLLLFLFLFRGAIPFIREPGPGRLLATTWVPKSFQQVSFGLLPLITGSMLVTVLATLIAVPFGVCGAVYIAELAGPREREIL